MSRACFEIGSRTFGGNAAWWRGTFRIPNAVKGRAPQGCQRTQDKQPRRILGTRDHWPVSRNSVRSPVLHCLKLCGGGLHLGGTLLRCSLAPLDQLQQLNTSQWLKHRRSTYISRCAPCCLCSLPCCSSILAEREQEQPDESVCVEVVALNWRMTGQAHVLTHHAILISGAIARATALLPAALACPRCTAISQPSLMAQPEEWVLSKTGLKRARPSDATTAPSADRAARKARTAEQQQQQQQQQQQADASAAQAVQVDLRAMTREVNALGGAHLDSRQSKKSFMNRDLEALGFATPSKPRTGIFPSCYHAHMRSSAACTECALSLKPCSFVDTTSVLPLMGRARCSSKDWPWNGKQAERARARS